MRASRPFLLRTIDFFCRLFFAEVGLYRIVREEVTRSSVLKALRFEGFEHVTRSQLMAVQQGKLFISTTPGVELSRGRNSTLGTANSPQLVRWCDKQTRGEVNQVEIEDVDTYKHLLGLLLEGSTVWKAIGNIHIGTIALVLHLVWLIGSICIRLDNHLRVSLLELFALYALTAFVLERLVNVSPCLAPGGCRQRSCEPPWHPNHPRVPASLLAAGVVYPTLLVIPPLDSLHVPIRPTRRANPTSKEDVLRCSRNPPWSDAIGGGRRDVWCDDLGMEMGETNSVHSCGVGFPMEQGVYDGICDNPGAGWGQGAIRPAGVYAEYTPYWRLTCIFLVGFPE